MFEDGPGLILANLNQCVMLYFCSYILQDILQAYNELKMTSLTNFLFGIRQKETLLIALQDTS